MRHGIAFRKLSRTSSSRRSLLRNLVSSLVEHERITTTVAKAKEASRIAEWVISWGKRGTDAQKRRAEAFLMNPTRTLPKLFNELSTRYANRSGGYTRVVQFGHRKGDHAPQAILELVDNPHDLRFHMTARIVGRELNRVIKSHPNNKRMAIDVMEWATSTSPITATPKAYDLLDDLTKLNMRKALRYVRTTSSSSSEADSSSSSLEPSSASTSSSSSSSVETNTNTQLTLQQFNELAKASFLKTSAISQVPLWSNDLAKYEDLLLHASESQSSTPITLPGHGRKLWAGQEDLNGRYDGWDSSLTTTPPSTSRKSKSRAVEKEEQEWEDEEDQPTTTVSTTEQRQQRDLYLKKKLRHPGGRNGNHGQRSAIARSKGHTAPPRTLRERFLRLDMPVTSRG